MRMCKCIFMNVMSYVWNISRIKVYFLYPVFSLNTSIIKTSSCH